MVDLRSHSRSDSTGHQTRKSPSPELRSVRGAYKRKSKGPGPDQEVEEGHHDTTFSHVSTLYQLHAPSRPHTGASHQTPKSPTSCEAHLPHFLRLVQPLIALLLVQWVEEPANLFISSHSTTPAAAHRETASDFSLFFIHCI
ncbi:low affinity immunoglobulin gamma Fc region receptor III-like protein [Lates japonicus]|nr:low affinity immunoglobulin gamma Fc region receptor III-like protein [Lates japonicus]